MGGGRATLLKDTKELSVMGEVWAKRGNRISLVEHKGNYFIVPRLLVTANGGTCLRPWVLDRLLSMSQLKKDSDDALSITYHPGFACNLTCSYCYQVDSSGLRPQNKRDKAITTEQMARFLAGYARDMGKSEFSVTYLGGEPLLYIKDILDFHRCLTKFMPVNGSFLVTNGVLINEENIKYLKIIDCYTTQITIDGAEDVHNMYRKTKSGWGSYRKIIDSILLLLQEGFYVSIRVNVTSVSINSIESLLDDLYINLGHPNNMSIYFALIDNTNMYHDSIKESNEYIDKYVNAYRVAVKKGFKISRPGHSGYCSTCRTPRSELGYQPEGVVLTSSGKLYSCWDSAGQQSMEVGNVIDGYNPAAYEKSWVQCGYLDCNKLSQREAINSVILMLKDEFNMIL